MTNTLLTKTFKTQFAVYFDSLYLQSFHGNMSGRRGRVSLPSSYVTGRGTPVWTKRILLLLEKDLESVERSINSTDCWTSFGNLT